MIEPWELDKMLAARQHFDERSGIDAVLDRCVDSPRRMRETILGVLAWAAGLVLLGWVLGRGR